MENNTEGIRPATEEYKLDEQLEEIERPGEVLSEEVKGDFGRATLGAIEMEEEAKKIEEMVNRGEVRDAQETFNKDKEIIQESKIGE